MATVAASTEFAAERLGSTTMGGRRLRVVHCIDSFAAGGTELNLVRTLEKLDPQTYDLFVVVLNDRGALRDRVIGTGAKVHTVEFPRLNSVEALRQAFRLIRWLRAVRPNVVHSHDRYTNLFVTPCARLAGVPLVISSRRWWTAMPRWVYGAGNRLAYRISHRIVVNSTAAARLMATREGVPASRLVVLPNFVEEHAFAPLDEEERNRARRAFGIPEAAVVVTAVAVFRPEKDLETLIEAIAMLAGRHRDLHLLLVGSGPCEERLRLCALQHDVAERVHFPGYRSSPPNLHGYGEVSALCSLHEGFPNTIVEAMAAGKPVVATDVGGIPDAVEDGCTGFLVPPRSADRLAAAIGRLLDDPDLRRTMGDAGRAKAHRCYEATAVLARLGAIYAEGARGSALANSVTL